MARADRRLRPDHRGGWDAVDDHRLCPMPFRFHHRPDALHDHGVAGASGRRSLGHPALGHPDRGGGDDADQFVGRRTCQTDAERIEFYGWTTRFTDFSLCSELAVTLSYASER